jgi:hypothetical protein
MSNNNAIKIKRSEVAVWRIIDGEVVILAPEGASINALTGCGGRIWELIEEETTIPEITSTICNEYEVEPEQAEQDIIEFIHKLAKMKLVDVRPLYQGVAH